jgi:hypothetical protein
MSCHAGCCMCRCLRRTELHLLSQLLGHTCFLPGMPGYDNIIPMYTGVLWQLHVFLQLLLPFTRLAGGQDDPGNSIAIGGLAQ